MGPAEDTIFALATARGKAGVAIVRLSGTRSLDVLEALGGTPPPPRGTRTCRLRDAEGLVLDHALVLRFAEGASFTGEAVVELHLHGSIAVVRAVLRAIEATGLARQAEPGEFTRRGLLNDRLDLTQVQGLRDMIDAETEVQRRHAMRVYSGEMAQRIQGWRRGLVRAIALLEARIDFADEEVPENVMPEVAALLAQVRDALRVEIGGTATAARIRSGFEVALVGQPNVGKSSLLNRLTQSEAAIVSNVAGTTRDVIEVRMDINGLPVTFLDMAGLRETSDAIESLGIARAIERATAADMRIFLHEEVVSPDLGVSRQPDDLSLRTKIDISGGDGISAVSGAGVQELLDQVRSVLEGRVAQAGLVSSDRDRAMLVEAASRLEDALAMLNVTEVELTAQALRDVAEQLRAMIGGVDVEAILDEVFSTFCIGK